MLAECEAIVVCHEDNVLDNWLFVVRMSTRFFISPSMVCRARRRARRWLSMSSICAWVRRGLSAINFGLSETSSSLKAGVRGTISEENQVSYFASYGGASGCGSSSDDQE